MSGRQDSNLRPPAPKAGAITGLRYAPKFFNGAQSYGFEPYHTNKIFCFIKYYK